MSTDTNIKDPMEIWDDVTKTLTFLAGGASREALLAVIKKYNTIKRLIVPNFKSYFATDLDDLGSLTLEYIECPLLIHVKASYNLYLLSIKADNAESVDVSYNSFLTTIYAPQATTFNLKQCDRVTLITARPGIEIPGFKSTGEYRRIPIEEKSAEK